ncbi:kinase-like domain-containing protein [Polychytrium aggregatum]|uniref:kinase-like domain-containing protein n=1 Tax=Polychytrium aggregatum TaxID=110093 RepID=UPI0022FE09AA|nr:kinase-like domain-containing protein [Polychytrium aggregatum]KAI9205657.1 kinase-like domain-containing protein [Polychytrium aggregatum]
MTSPQRGPTEDGQTTSSVRKGMELDVTRLESFLSGVKTLKLQPPLDIRQFKLGESNPTYFLKDARGSRWVLRKKPPGKLISKTAHAVEREYRILHALGTKTDVPVPKVYVLCEDPAVLGTPFYVMEFLDGRIFDDNLLRDLQPYAPYRHLRSVVRTLAKLHKTDIVAVGLESYGKHGGFYTRQIESLYRVSQAQAAVKDSSGDSVGEIKGIAEILAWFKRNQVRDEVTLMHGDFKLNNVVFHQRNENVIGILDWELSSIGHPLADLANLLLPWYAPGDGYNSIMGIRNAKRPMAIPEAEELIQYYCQMAGRPYPIPRWDFCIAFAFFRTAVILQGIAARIKIGQSSSPLGKTYAGLFQTMAECGFEIVARGDLDQLARL